MPAEAGMAPLEAGESGGHCLRTFLVRPRVALRRLRLLALVPLLGIGHAAWSADPAPPAVPRVLQVDSVEGKVRIRRGASACRGIASRGTSQ